MAVKMKRVLSMMLVITMLATMLGMLTLSSNAKVYIDSEAGFFDDYEDYEVKEYLANSDAESMGRMLKDANGKNYYSTYYKSTLGTYAVTDQSPLSGSKSIAMYSGWMYSNNKDYVILDLSSDIKKFSAEFKVRVDKLMDGKKMAFRIHGKKSAQDSSAASMVCQINGGNSPVIRAGGKTVPLEIGKVYTVKVVFEIANAETAPTYTVYLNDLAVNAAPANFPNALVNVDAFSLLIDAGTSKADTTIYVDDMKIQKDGAGEPTGTTASQPAIDPGAVVIGDPNVSATYTGDKKDGIIKVHVDGKALSFDVPPQIINDRTMLPLRAIFEALNAQIEWDDAAKTVTSTKNGTVVKLTIGNPVATVNGQEITLDSPGVIVDERTLVPVRFVAEAFGAKVWWEPEVTAVHVFSGENILSDRDKIDVPVKVVPLTINDKEYVSLGEMTAFWRNRPLTEWLEGGLGLEIIPDYLLKTDFPYQKRSFPQEIMFTDNINTVRFLGGWKTGAVGNNPMDLVYRDKDGTLKYR